MIKSGRLLLKLMHMQQDDDDVDEDELHALNT